MENEDLRIDEPARVAGWLAVAEWTPQMAAYLFLNLDPHFTERATDRQGWFCDWICRDRSLLTDEELSWLNAEELGDTYARDRNLELALERMLGFTSTVNQVDLRSPDQWLQWARTKDLLPRWLHVETQANKARVTDSFPDAVDLRKNGISKAGGHARHQLSRVGKLKEELRPRILAWCSSCPRGVMSSFASQLYEELSDRFPDIEIKGPRYQTILNWISAARQGKHF